MKATEYLKSINFEIFCHTLMTSQTKMIDRDCTDMNLLQYENFENFYESASGFYHVYYENEETLLKAVFRNFLHAQLAFFVQDYTARKIVDDSVSYIVACHYETLKLAMLKVWPKVYAKIIEKNLENKGVFF